MRSVASIKKITKTMEMVSVPKMRKSAARAQASKEYATAVFNLLSYVAKQKYLKGNHVLFKKRKMGRILIIVMASDNGLCGTYNLNIYKALAAFKNKYGEEIDCATVGRYAEKAARRLHLPIITSFIKLPEQNAADEIGVLSKIIIDNFKEKSYQNVFILYTEFIKASEFKPSIKEILPLDEKILEDILTKTEEPKKEEPTKENLALYLFEPSETSILEIVLPRLLGLIIYQSFLESMASEHSSRMFAMKIASDNATNMFKDLTLSFNYARQDAITRELAEIVGGASALVS